MSMHDVEYATEVLVEAVVGTQISNEAKRAALMQLFEAEDRCDVGFCRLRYYEALESCGFSAFIPRDDVPEDLVRKVSYWEDFDDGEYAYVDRTFAIWEELRGMHLKCLSENRRLRKIRGQIHCIRKMENILLQRLKAVDGRCI